MQIVCVGVFPKDGGVEPETPGGTGRGRAGRGARSWEAGAGGAGSRQVVRHTSSRSNHLAAGSMKT